MAEDIHERIIDEHTFPLTEGMLYSIQCDLAGLTTFFEELEAEETENLLALLLGIAIRESTLPEEMRMPYLRLEEVFELQEDGREVHLPSLADEKEFICMDCGRNTLVLGEYYMVQTELWLQVVPGRVGMLCIECLEKRLGRTLTPADFTDAPLNTDEEHLSQASDLLRNRLGF